jgi:hypothetical protein
MKLFVARTGIEPIGDCVETCVNFGPTVVVGTVEQCIFYSYFVNSLRFIVRQSNDLYRQ